MMGPATHFAGAGRRPYQIAQNSRAVANPFRHLLDLSWLAGVEGTATRQGVVRNLVVAPERVALGIRPLRLDLRPEPVRSLADSAAIQTRLGDGGAWLGNYQQRKLGETDTYAERLLCWNET